MKRLHYRVGVPGWQVAARFGVPLSFRTHVFRDREANVFWATSPDIDGLAVEAATLEELVQEAALAGRELVELQLGVSPTTDPVFHFDDAACAA